MTIVRPELSHCRPEISGAQNSDCLLIALLAVLASRIPCERAQRHYSADRTQKRSPITHYELSDYLEATGRLRATNCKRESPEDR
jgi:hypothetical protein